MAIPGAAARSGYSPCAAMLLNGFQSRSMSSRSELPRSAFASATLSMVGGIVARPIFYPPSSAARQHDALAADSVRHLPAVAAFDVLSPGGIAARLSCWYRLPRWPNLERIAVDGVRASCWRQARAGMVPAAFGS